MAGIFDGYDLNALQQGYAGYKQQSTPAPAPAPAAPSFLDRVGSFVSGIPGAIAQPFQDIGRNVGYALGSGSVLDQANRTNRMAGQTVSQAKALWQSGKIDKNTYIHILSNVNEDLSRNTQNLNELRANVNPTQTLAAGAQVATYALAPELSALKPAAAIGANAALGGVMGGASAVENGGNASDAARNALIGIGIGGGLSAAGGLLGRVLARRAPAAAAAATGSTNAATNLAGDLSPEARNTMLTNFRQQAAQAGPSIESPRGPITVSSSGAGGVQPNGGSVFTPLNASPEQVAQAGANMDALRASNNSVIGAARAAGAESDRINAQIGGGASLLPPNLSNAAQPAAQAASRPADVQAFIDAWNSGDYRAVQNAIDNLKNPQLASSMEGMLSRRTANIPGLAAPTAATDAQHVTNFLKAYNSGDFQAAQQAIQEANPNIRDTLSGLVNRQTVQPGSIEELQARTAGLANKFDQAQTDRTATAAIQQNLPKGYVAQPDGSIIAPSGQTVSLGDLSQLDRKMPQFVRDFELARSQGDTNIMNRISAAHPGDARVALPGSPATPAGTAAVAASKAGARGNLLQRVGLSKQAESLHLKLPPSVNGAAREERLAQLLSDNGALKAFSNTKSVYASLPDIIAQKQAQIGDILAADKTVVPAADLKAKLQSMIEDSDFAANAPNENGITRFKNTIAKQVDEATGPNGNLSAVDLHNLKSRMQEDLNSAFSKATSGKDLSATDHLRMQLRDAVNGYMPVSVRQLGNDESILIDASKYLGSGVHRGAMMTGVLGKFIKPFGITERGGEEGLAHINQSIGTAEGAAIRGVGNAAAAVRGGLLGRVGGGLVNGATNLAHNLPELPPAVSTALGTAGSYAPLLGAVGGVNYQPPTAAPAAPPQVQPASQPNGQPLDVQLAAAHLPANGQPPDITYNPNPNTNIPFSTHTLPGAENGLGLTSADVEQAMIADAVYNNGANLSKLSAIHTILQNQEKNTQPQSLPQVAVNQVNMAQRAQSGLDQIEAAFSKAGAAGKGPLTALEGSVLGNVVPGGADVHNLNNVIQLSLAPIAAALGLPQSNAMLQNLAGQLPNQYDTQESAHAKLNVIRQQIQEYMNNYLQNESNYVQPNNSTLDALAQMSAGGVAQ